jgi:ferredoxin--NADP+ reductase
MLTDGRQRAIVTGAVQKRLGIREGQADRPALRVAIVGAGPAGFYAAGHLLSTTDLHIRVDLFDRLPTPFGLVRGGVAPDHPKIKSVTRVFEKIAASPTFRFLGGVELGRDVHRSDLLARYHAVIYAVGAAGARPLNIPGEELPGCVSAPTFVGWYNGHPDHVGSAIDLSGDRAVVIGNGNVALDCARMLMLTARQLRGTDAADHAVRDLAHSTIAEAVVVGRRGPVQAAFTTPELRELGELESEIIVEPRDIELDPASRAWLEAGERVTGIRRNLEVLTGYAERPRSAAGRRIVLRFLRSPVEIRGDGRVEEIVLERNVLLTDSAGRIGTVATGERETLRCGLVVSAIGYIGTPLPELPYDRHRGIVPSLGGRVLDGAGRMTAEYVAGWIRRGPSGVIGTNKKCAQEAADVLLQDAREGRLLPPPVEDDFVESLQRSHMPVVAWEGWRRIDEHERTAGASVGRPRLKLTTYDGLHAVAAREPGGAPG